MGLDGSGEMVAANQEIKITTARDPFMAIIESDPQIYRPWRSWKQNPLLPLRAIDLSSPWNGWKDNLHLEGKTFSKEIKKMKKEKREVIPLEALFE